MDPKKFDFFAFQGIEIEETTDKIIVMDNIVIFPKKTFEVIRSVLNLLERVKSAYWNLSGVYHERRRFSDFAKELEKVMKEFDEAFQPPKK